MTRMNGTRSANSTPATISAGIRASTVIDWPLPSVCVAMSAASSATVSRFAAGWFTIDETTAVSTAQTDLRSQRVGFWVTAVVIFVGWNLTTLAGALLGDLLGDVRQYGLDAAAAAAFLGLLWPRLRQLQPIVVAVGAAAVAAVLTPWLPPGLPVIAAALVAVVVGVTNCLGKRS